MAPPPIAAASAAPTVTAATLIRNSFTMNVTPFTRLETPAGACPPILVVISVTTAAGPALDFARTPSHLHLTMSTVYYSSSCLCVDRHSQDFQPSPPNPPIESRIFRPILFPLLHLHQKSNLLKDTHTMMSKFLHE